MITSRMPGVNSRRFVHFILFVLLFVFLWINSAKAAFSYVMVPYGTIPRSDWISAETFRDTPSLRDETSNIDQSCGVRVYFDPEYSTFYIIEYYPGDTVRFDYWDTIDTEGSFTLSVDTPIPFQYPNYLGGSSDPDFSEEPPYASNSFDINSQISDSLLQGNWGQVDNIYREQTRLNIEHSLAIGHAVRLYNADGSSVMIFPNGDKDILSASVASNVEVFVAQDGSYQIGVAGTAEGTVTIGEPNEIEYIPEKAAGTYDFFPWDWDFYERLLAPSVDPFRSEYNALISDAFNRYENANRNLYVLENPTLWSQVVQEIQNSADVFNFGADFFNAAPFIALSAPVTVYVLPEIIIVSNGVIAKSYVIASGSGATVLAKLNSLYSNLQTSSLSIAFGNNPNQVYHTFRHIQGLGSLTQNSVQTAVTNHLSTVVHLMQPGKPFNQIIEIGGYRLQYTAYLLSNGTINVGRIHPVP